MSIRAMVVPFLLVAAAAVRAEPVVGPAAVEDPVLKQMEQRYRQNMAAYSNNPAYFVRRGLLADRAGQRVVLDGQAMKIGSEDAVEFFLIGEESGKAYESLAVTFAKPGDVRAALEFIGMPVGRPVDYQGLHFWAKGERVVMTFRWKGAAGQEEARAEDLVLNRQTGKTLPRTGLVFAGSFETDSPDKPGTKVWMADAYDPFAVACNYNEPAGILDVPRRAPQGNVYETQFPNPERRLPPAEFLEIVLQPEYTDGRRRVRDIVLRVAPAAGTTGADLKSVTFQLADPAGKALSDGASLESMLEYFTKRVGDGQDPFVTLRIDPALPLGTAAEVCALLASVESDNGIRMEGPPAGELYYRAYMGGEQHRDRQARYSQPWELHLTSQGGAVKASLTRVEEIENEKEIRPDLKVTDIPVASPAEVKTHVESGGSKLPVLLVYAPATMANGAMLEYVRPVLATHPTMYILLDPPPAAPTAVK